METVSGNLALALRIKPGITAIIGSGGKSTLLKTLGLELMRAGGRRAAHPCPCAGKPPDACPSLEARRWPWPESRR